MIRALVFLTLVIAGVFGAPTQAPVPAPRFKVIAFYTRKEDLAHISFDAEANRWFADLARTHAFSYEATTDWQRLNAESLAQYQVVLFLDTRPEDPAQREAFKKYMLHGGGWMGFHFAGFALTPSKYPQDWNWYHNEFLGAGSYVSNTWHPTSAVLRVEAPHTSDPEGLAGRFTSRP